MAERSYHYSVETAARDAGRRAALRPHHGQRVDLKPPDSQEQTGKTGSLLTK